MYGPSPSDCSYTHEVNFDDGIQLWEVENSGIYRIEAAGAEGGRRVGSSGLGAYAAGDFELEKGEILQIVVGQHSESLSDGSGGGGGSFVVNESDEPLLIAAGGGSDQSEPERDGRDFNWGDEGGSTNSGGGGGGGFSEDGTDDESEGGSSFLNGALGGENTFSDNPSHGGFGGGGGGSNNYCGGGGGYSGGEGGTSCDGGGSYNDGDNRVMVTGDNYGSGYVNIESLINPEDPEIESPLVVGKDDSSPSSMDIDFDVVIDDDDGDASDNELEFCEIEVSGQDNSGTVTVNDTDPSGNNCNFEIENDDYPNWEPGEEVAITAYVEDRYGGTDTLTEHYEFPYPTPEIIDTSFSDYDNLHAFNLTVDTEYGRDNFEESLELYVENQDGIEEDIVFEESESNKWKVEDDRNVEYIIKIEPEDCISGTCSGNYDFSVQDELEIEINLTDDGTGPGIETVTHEIPNKPPEATLIEPDHESTQISEDVELEVEVNDPEGDSINATIIGDGGILKEDTNIPSGERMTYTWENLDIGLYEWYVELEDDYDSSSSDMWSFTRIVSQSYRPTVSVAYDYSAVVVPSGESGFLFFEVTNQQPSGEFTTYLESDELEADFVETGETSKTYELSSGETERLHVRVSGENEGEHILNVSTEDDTLGVNTTETFPVFIQSREAESHGIPGLNIYFIGLILLLAASYFWFSI